MKQERLFDRLPSRRGRAFESVLGDDYVDCGECRVLARRPKAGFIALSYEGLAPAWIPWSQMSPECELHRKSRGILEIRIWLARKLGLYVRNGPNPNLKPLTGEN